MLRILLATLAAAFLLLPVEAEAEKAVSFQHRGVTIVGKPLAPGKTFDISIISAKQGAETIKKSLDILYESSPFSAKAVERLKTAGNVVLIYDPAFPANEFTKVTIAAFLPDFYQKGGNTKDFVAVVGRFGAKWTPHDLAPILAHELTGHGMQHYRGRLSHVREIDLECEAYMYQEKAYQDLGFDKRSTDMVEFRQVLEKHWCAEFKTWQRKNRPNGIAHWEKLNPDIPKLLNEYLAYIEALRESGVATRAVSLASQAQQRKNLAKIAKLKKSKKADDHYQLALIYGRGLGVKVDQKLAAAWLLKSANAGHVNAQYDLARAFWSGKGVKKSKTNAAKWAQKAAANGSADAAFTYGAMLYNGDGVKRNLEAGKKWFKVAADKGHKKARATLKKLGASN